MSFVLGKPSAQHQHHILPVQCFCFGEIIDIKKKHARKNIVDIEVYYSSHVARQQLHNLQML